MSENALKQLLPPRWQIALLLVLAAVVLWLQLGDATGDRGMNNVFSYLAVALGLGIYLVWFVGFSGQRAVLRLGVLTLLVLVVVVLNVLVRVEGWTGAMVPVVRWTWPPPEERMALAEATLPGGGEVDLATRTPVDFPGYLGGARDAVVRGVELAPWQPSGPELLWRRPVGAGWSGFAVVNGVAVTQEEAGGEQHVVARDVTSGAELWRAAFGGAFDHPLGGRGPRATPTIAGGRVFAQGPGGVLVCLDGADGSGLWSQDLLASFGVDADEESEWVQFGRSGSPLVVGDVVVVPVGGDPDEHQAGIVAFDVETGEVRWEGPPRAISHASPTLGVLDGVEQLVVLNEDTVTGHDPADGALLWEHPWPGSTGGDANTSQPVLVGGDRVLVSKGYGQGSKLFRVRRREDGSWVTSEVWASRRSLRTKLTSAVVRDGHAYALSDGMLECVSLEDGRRVWKEGRHGHGQLLLVGAHLLVSSEEGELLLLEASPAGEGEVLGRFPALEGKTWNTFALAGDLVLVRNDREAAAVRLPVLGAPAGAAASSGGG